MNWTNNKIHSASHTLQCPSTNITLGRFGKFVTLELTYALYQSVIVWKRFAYSKRVTKSVGSSTHCNNKCDNTVKKGLLNSSYKGMLEENIDSKLNKKTLIQQEPNKATLLSVQKVWPKGKTKGTHFVQW